LPLVTAYLLLTYAATAAISSSVVFLAVLCIAALSLVLSRLLHNLSWLFTYPENCVARRGCLA